MKSLYHGFLLSMFLVLLSACTDENDPDLSCEELFKLSYGNFETELNMSSLTSGYNGVDTRIAMRDGLFYIANSGGKKVIQLNSFGDLLSLYYNPQDSIIFSNKKAKNNGDSTWHIFEHPFEYPSFVAVNSKKKIYVVDVLPDERIEYDSERDVALRNVVGWFNSNGEYEYLGQEGIGGTPFPVIAGFYINQNDEIIVVCRTHEEVTVYWYYPNGDLLYKIPFKFDAIPVVKKRVSNIFSVIDSVIPDASNRKLYVKIDTYKSEIDPATGVTAGINYAGSVLYMVNATTGSYEHYIEIPAYIGKEIDRNGTIQEFNKVYEMLGITENGWCFFITSQDTGYDLFIINFTSQRVFRKSIIVEKEKLLYNTFYLSSEGILSALLADNQHAHIVWWRADQLIRNSL